MKPLFYSTKILDQAVKDKFALTDDIMMENAASALESEVRALAVAESSASSPCTVLIVCGSGNNGADGLVLARRLFACAGLHCVVFQPLKPKTASCCLQHLRAEKIGVSFVSGCVPCDVVVDCLFGSGLHGDVSPELQAIVAAMNGVKAAKIACDIPSCLGTASEHIFAADVTVTMGALKTLLYDDRAKSYTGRIVCADLGISRAVFEKSGGSDCVPEAYLLEQSDICLPSRNAPAVHKGTFGHAAVVCGEKPGAAVIASMAAFAFGAGLVTMVNKSGFTAGVPFDIMQSPQVPHGVTALACGMGLGATEAEMYAQLLSGEYAELPCVVDADMCGVNGLRALLEKRCSMKCPRLVLTPHPKEFASVLARCGLDTISASDVQQERIAFARRFCTAFPGIVLVLKGANPVIACSTDGDTVQLFINPLGKPCLAKGGSGDVLSGLVCALLAQGYAPLEAAVQGSLAHAYASCLHEVSSFGMSPFDLINEIKHLENVRTPI